MRQPYLHPALHKAQSLSLFFVPAAQVLDFDLRTGVPRGDLVSLWMALCGTGSTHSLRRRNPRLGRTRERRKVVERIFRNEKKVRGRDGPTRGVSSTYVMGSDIAPPPNPEDEEI